MDFFNDINIEKYKIDADSGELTRRKLIRVPVQFAARERWMAIVSNATNRRTMDPAANTNPVELEWILPRISVNLTGLNYDSIRHTNKMNQMRDAEIDVEGRRKDVIYAPVPYNLDIELAIISKNMDDMWQIVEQILPYFSPSFSVDVKLVSFMPHESIPIVLTSINPDILEEMDQVDDRIFTFSMNFTMKINYYFQQRNEAIIRQVEDNFYDPTLLKFTRYTQTAFNPTPTFDDPAQEPTSITITEQDLP